MNDNQNNTCQSCSCTHHSIIPVLIILFATTFLLGYQGIFDMMTVNIIWPILVGIGGITKLAGHNCKCC